MFIITIPIKKQITSLLLLKLQHKRDALIQHIFMFLWIWVRHRVPPSLIRKSKRLPLESSSSHIKAYGLM